jgi:hypothetical protein
MRGSGAFGYGKISKKKKKTQGQICSKGEKSNLPADTLQASKKCQPYR